MLSLREEMEEAMKNVPVVYSAESKKPCATHEEKRAMIEREIHIQLWTALCTLAARHYDLAKIGAIPMGDYGGETMSVSLRHLDDDVCCADYVDMAGRVGQLVEDLETFAENFEDDGIFKIMSGNGVRFVSIEYDLGVFFDTLYDLITEVYPDDKDILSHLNIIQHLEERQALNVPAHKLA